MHGRVINIHLPSDSKLTIPMSILDKERKLKFSLPLFFVDGASKGLHGLTAFIKPFEAPQRGVKINI